MSGILITNWNEAARVRAVARAEAWTRNQAERLGVPRDEILAAIRERGWLPSDIEALAVAEAALLDGPPHGVALARVRTAPIMPIRLRRHEVERHCSRVRRVRAA